MPLVPCAALVHVPIQPAVLLLSLLHETVPVVQDLFPDCKGIVCQSES